MLIYIFVVVFPLIVGRLYRRKYVSVKSSYELKKIKQTRMGYICLAAIPMFFLIAFRSQNIGADTGMYLNSFERIDGTEWSSIFLITTMEKGYVLFVKIIGLFTDNPLIYQIICALIYLLSITVFLNELEDNHFFVLFLFGTLGVYMFMFTGVRQCIAICICLLSYRYIRDRKIIPFLLMIILASYFHKSAFFFIAAYLIYSLNLSIGTIFVYVPVSFLSLYLLNKLQWFFDETLDYAYEIGGGLGGTIFSVVVVCMMVFTLFIAIRNKKTTKYSRGLINIGYIATVFWIIRMFAREAERASYYFIVFLFVAFSNAVSCLKPQKERNLVKFLVIVMALMLFVYRLITNQLLFLPYRFFEF